MDSSKKTFGNEDLARLNDKDKAELSQFLANAEQKSRIQKNTHSLTEVCWKKCVTGSIKGPKLDRSEETCLANCVERFLDMNFLTMKHLESMRQ